jgi:hypothetical protein
MSLWFGISARDSKNFDLPPPGGFSISTMSPMRAPRIACAMGLRQLTSPREESASSSPTPRFRDAAYSG